eukprot:gene20190-26208_t
MFINYKVEYIVILKAILMVDISKDIV